MQELNFESRLFDWSRFRKKLETRTKPFQDAEFELLYDVGLTPHYGVLDLLVKDKIVERTGAWYQFGEEAKFQAKTFNEGFMTDDKFKTLREKIGL